jgi:hypothetical protein
MSHAVFFLGFGLVIRSKRIREKWEFPGIAHPLVNQFGARLAARVADDSALRAPTTLAIVGVDPADLAWRDWLLLIVHAVSFCWGFRNLRGAPMVDRDPKAIAVFYPSSPV